jgi:NAD-dependent dihydropyrimidine dehydrogenase PreA subunit
MKNLFFNHNHAKTQFIQFNSKNCRACWKCIENCSNKVLEKIDFLGHRHAHIENPDKCTGCLNCLSACEFNALSVISSDTNKSQTSIRTEKVKFNKRAFVLITFIVALFSLLAFLVR